ncbi:MAG: LysM peptidoglycan-binding domain-containing protein [Treponema sp.]|jgi:nucleoid-associated protein YgaU|nr:LysM peptidoglycan-binding domain-containing protein [Treponema sp.]
MATIGIKIANGNFYPLLDENDPQKKKFALIPARKGQKRAQIDFYKSDLRDMEDAQHIGRLLFGNEKREMDGDALDLAIESNGQGKISASAKNLKTGEDRQLVIWLKAADQDDGRESERNSGRNSAGEKFETLRTPEITEETAGLLPIDLLYEQKFAKKFPLVPVCIAILSLAAICGALWVFLFRGKALASETPAVAATAETPDPQEPPAPALAETPPEQEPDPQEPPTPAYAETPPEQKPDPQEPPAPAYAETPSEQEPDPQEPPTPALAGEIAKPAPQSEQKLKRPLAPVRSYKAPKPIPKNGTTYRVRWGDTLWDITDVFYNNPWLYARLARYNKLRPSAILLPGVVLRIPPKL